MSCFTDFLKDGLSSSAALQAAVAAAVNGDRKLFFPPGEYHFYPEHCPQRYCCFSNNDEGVKTVAILLEDVEDFTVSGYGALLIFHGRISPLCAFNCRKLTVEGLRVDFEDSFVSDADLVRRGNGVAWFRFGGRHRVDNGKIVFTGDFYDNLSGVLPFHSYDPGRGEIDFSSVTVSIPNRNIRYENGLVGVEDRFDGVTASAFMVKHELRLCPGMVFDNCRDIQINAVTLYHAAGMGFLIQNSENCAIDSAVIEPRGRRASVSDDALHITDCRGKIKISRCRFSGTLDDSINVHGVFRKLKSRIPGGKMYYLEPGHYQQQGIFNVRPGDHLQLLRRSDGMPYATLELTGTKLVNKALMVVDFDEKQLPASFTEGDPGWILETRAELEITDTVCRSMSNRGVLASGLEKIRICGCHFHTAGAGVFISGDFSYWYESGPVGGAVIENNFFDNCCYNPRGATKEVLAVFPELRSLKEDFCYHNHICVRNNRFRSRRKTLISMMSVEHAEVKNNCFEEDQTYTLAYETKAGYFFTDENSPMAAFLHCSRIECENNCGFHD